MCVFGHAVREHAIITIHQNAPFLATKVIFWDKILPYFLRFLRSVHFIRTSDIMKEQNKKLSCRKERCDCCVDQFWANITGRRYFADSIGLYSTMVT